MLLPGTVLLHLFAGALARRSPHAASSKSIPSIYIPLPSPFQAMEDFIEEAVIAYNLDLFHCPPPEDPRLPIESVATPSTAGILMANQSEYFRTAQQTSVGKSKGGEGMRQALELYKDQFPHIESILVGTRRGDPHGGSKLFCMG
jgi:FAD synthetase